MSCRFVSTTEPRVVSGRHTGACSGEACPGCAPCPSSHCRVCQRVHAEGTCAECMAVTRETLHDIGRMCDALPEEVESRGVQSEAAMLWGPAADPEARGHLEASVLAGRVPADYLDTADGELHPLFVLGTWDMLWRDALEHDEPAGRLTVETAIDYLDRQMTYMAGFEHVPFEDFARDLRQCRAHLESVLHDGEQVERSNVTCIEQGCEAPLVRVYASDEDHDGWRCSAKNCGAHYSQARYVVAMHQHLSDKSADRWVRISDALAVLTRPEMTLRTWVANGDVASTRDEVGVWVWWPDVRHKDKEASRRVRNPKPCA